VCSELRLLEMLSEEHVHFVTPFETMNGKPS